MPNCWDHNLLNWKIVVKNFIIKLGFIRPEFNSPKKSVAKLNLTDIEVSYSIKIIFVVYCKRTFYVHICCFVVFVLFCFQQAQRKAIKFCKNYHKILYVPTCVHTDFLCTWSLLLCTCFQIAEIFVYALSLCASFCKIYQACIQSVSWI